MCLKQAAEIEARGFRRGGRVRRAFQPAEGPSTVSLQSTFSRSGGPSPVMPAPASIAHRFAE